MTTILWITQSDVMTTNERNFLVEQELPEELFIDAKGLSVRTFEGQMKSLKKIFAYNSTPCGQFGHTLRSIAGHCIQCDTAKIAFTLRHFAFGTVYIAGSIKGKIIKVGTTSSKEARKESLNKGKYGNQDDWEILLSFKCLGAGALEFEIHKLLKPYAATDIKYKHENSDQQAYELFRCSYKKAKDTLLQVTNNLKTDSLGMTENARKIDSYNFPTLRKM